MKNNKTIEKIESLRNEMMKISRTYYSRENFKEDSTPLKNYIAELKRLETEAKTCPDSPTRVEVIVILQRSIDSSTVTLKRKFSQ